MKLFITGATGGIGREICKFFIEKNYEIIANGRKQKIGNELIAMGCEFIKGDMCEINFAQNFENIDYIIHAGALSSPWGKKSDFINSNVIATEKIIEAAKIAKIKGMIFISSPSVYSCEKELLNITSDFEYAKQPLNYYSLTKIMAEKIVRQNVSNDFKAIILRPRAVICKNDNVLLPRFLRLIKKGNFPLFNNGAALVEPTDIKDVCNAIYLALNKIDKLNGEDFNISGGKSMPLKIMIENLAYSMNLKVNFFNINYKIARFFVIILETICKLIPNRPEPILTKYTLSALSFSQTFNLEKSEKLLGFSPQYDAFEFANEIANKLVCKNGKN